MFFVFMATSIVAFLHRTTRHAGSDGYHRGLWPAYEQRNAKSASFNV